MPEIGNPVITFSTLAVSQNTKVTAGACSLTAGTKLPRLDGGAFFRSDGAPAPFIVPKILPPEAAARQAQRRGIGLVPSL